MTSRFLGRKEGSEFGTWRVIIGDVVLENDDVLFDREMLDGSDEENIEFLLENGWKEVGA